MRAAASAIWLQLRSAEVSRSYLAYTTRIEQCR